MTQRTQTSCQLTTVVSVESTLKIISSVSDSSKTFFILILNNKSF